MWKQMRMKLFGVRTVLLFSYFVIILLCISLVGTISFYISYRSMAKGVETASARIVKQIENNLDNELQNKRYYLLSPYYYQEYIDNINAYASMDQQTKYAFRQRLGDLFLKSFNTTPIPDFVRFQIYYSNGEFLNGSDNSTHETPEAVRNAAWFKETVAQDGKVHFFHPVSDTDQENSGTAYSTSILIRDFANPIAFIIVRADYSAKLFQRISKDTDLTEHSEIWILDVDNKPIYTSNGGKLEMNNRLFSQMSGESGKFWTAGGTQRELVSYTRSSYSNWKTVLVMPEKEIFSPLDSIKTATIYTALIAFLFTSLMSLLFEHTITKPILNLHRSVNHIKRGDFSNRVEINRNDEIGRIAMNFNAMLEELQKLIETKYVYQIRLQQAQLTVLYSQINPHFLYNTLDSIKAMADYYQAGSIGEMAHSLADMFRYNTKSGDEIVTLREELIQIEAYMNIQRIRFEDKISYEVDIEPSLYEHPMLKMTLQPLVENAVFHGIERKRGKGFIRITACKEKGRVRITIGDDGVGMPENRLVDIRAGLHRPLYEEELALSTLDRGIGIRNVYTRYAIRHGDGFQFQIDSKQGVGTIITLMLDTDAAVEKISNH